MQNTPKTIDSATYHRYLSTSASSGRYGNSSFWMDDVVSAYDTRSGKFNILEHVQYQRAISNFVKIITNKDIKVRYHGVDSYTDGDTITIAGNISDKDFDATCGLALHEASHCIYTDMKLAHDLFLTKTAQAVVSHFPRLHIPSLLDITKSMDSTARQFDKAIFGISNWIEDRRIDTLVFNSSPGYKSYYHKLYEKYFLHPSISKMLLSSEYRTETLDSYQTRIVSLINPNSDLSALKGLKQIYALLDLPNIGRLTSVKDSTQLALEVLEIVATCCLNANTPVRPKAPAKGSKPSKASNPQDSSGSPSAADSPESTDGNESMSDELTDGGDESSEQGSEQETTDGNGSLSGSELNKINNILNDISKLIDGKVSKTTVHKSIKTILGAVDGSPDASIDSITYDGESLGGSSESFSVSVINQRMSPAELSKIKNGGESLIRQCMGWYDSTLWRTSPEIQGGLALGKKLGKKLVVRDQIRDTKFSRLDSGKIDRRLLHQCGYEVEQIFSQVHIDKYIPSVIDISIDASGSMSGDKWNKTQTLVIAIAKACSMVSNVQVKISYRYNPIISGVDQAMFLDVYDSKRDSLNHLCDCVANLIAENCTVDSIITAYQLKYKKISPGSNDLNSYFINISDGQPSANIGNVHYHGKYAHKHIQKCRKQIEAMGVKILSYFISSSNKVDANTKERFNADWGSKNTAFINPNELMPLAKTMNDLLMTKAK